MSDIAKWALLIAGALSVILLILAMPFMDFLNFEELGTAVFELLEVTFQFFFHARCLINNFLSPFGRSALTGLLMYIFFKWIITFTIKVTTWVYHFIFK